LYKRLNRESGLRGVSCAGYRQSYPLPGKLAVAAGCQASVYHHVFKSSTFDFGLQGRLVTLAKSLRPRSLVGPFEVTATSHNTLRDSKMVAAGIRHSLLLLALGPRR